MHGQDGLLIASTIAAQELDTQPLYQCAWHTVVCKPIKMCIGLGLLAILLTVGRWVLSYIALAAAGTVRYIEL